MSNSEPSSTSAASAEVEPLSDSELSPEERAEAQRYGRLGLACEVADKLLDLVYLTAAALAAPWLDQWLAGNSHLAQSDTLRLIALFAIVFTLHAAVSFPLSLFSGHVLEHRFKLSTLTLGGWFVRYLKRMGLAAALSLALFVGLFWLIWLCGWWWWLVAAAVFFLVSVALGQLVPVLIMPLFYKIVPLDRPELAQRIAELAEPAGLSVEGTYRIDFSVETVKANAALAGLGRTRRVLLGDTLLANFSNDEIAVVFAHEVGHHVHRHLPKMLVGGLLVSLAGFFVCHLALGGWFAALGQPLDYHTLPVFALPIIMLILAVFGLLFEPLQNTVSRHFEREADRYALDATGMREAFRSAFRKLARLNKDDPDPPRLEVILWHSHPPIGERLAAAESGEPGAADRPARL